MAEVNHPASTIRAANERYFDLLERIFGWHYSNFKQVGVSAHDYAWNIASQDGAPESFARLSEVLEEEINDLWVEVGPSVQTALVRTKATKNVYTGDVFPSSFHDVVAAQALYVDTVVLPDPLVRILGIREQFASPHQTYYLLKHVLSALRYKDLALADVDTPIVVFSGVDIENNQKRLKDLEDIASPAMLAFASDVAGRQFSSIEEVREYFESIASIDEATRKVLNPDRLAYSAGQYEGLSFEQRLPAWLRDIGERGGMIEMVDHPGRALLSTIIGRMLQAADATRRSQSFSGTALIGAPTSWQYLQWYWGYQAQISGTPESPEVESLISLAVSDLANSEQGLLTNVDHRSIIRLRREGAFEELRSALRRGLNELSSSSIQQPQAVTDVRSALQQCLSEEYEKHRAVLAEHKRLRRKLFGLDIPLCIGAVGMTVGGAILGGTTGGIVGGLSGLIGLPSAKDIVANRKKINDLQHKVSQSPTGILFSQDAKGK